MNAHTHPAPNGRRVKPVDLSAQNETTIAANQTTLLSPRFYTTNFEKLDAIDVSPVRDEWDAMIAAMKADPNKGHFKRNEEWDDISLDDLPEGLRTELVDFFVSSLTAEFSGCVLYKEMKRRGTNEDLKALFTYMSRDEARHAGFINDSLKDFGIGVNLGFLTKAKKYTYFQPKFIFYATYLSEKIGYARYITIFRHFEKHPEKRFHPIFKWFKQWCNDEFSHGEAFSLLMRADPKLLSGRNKLWIKFFLCAVYATMFVRDHDRPAFHQAAGLDIEQYDMRVFEITNECTKQCFPLVLDIDNPRFLEIMRSLNETAVSINGLANKKGIATALKRKALQAKAVSLFARLYFLPTKPNTIPETSKMVPVW